MTPEGATFPSQDTPDTTAGLAERLRRVEKAAALAEAGEPR